MKPTFFVRALWSVLISGAVSVLSKTFSTTAWAISSFKVVFAFRCIISDSCISFSRLIFSLAVLPMGGAIYALPSSIKDFFSRYTVFNERLSVSEICLGVCPPERRVATSSRTAWEYLIGIVFVNRTQNKF